MAQLVLEKIETPAVVEVNDLTVTFRGAEGFGSTGVTGSRSGSESSIGFGSIGFGGLGSTGSTGGVGSTGVGSGTGSGSTTGSTIISSGGSGS